MKLKIQVLLILPLAAGFLGAQSRSTSTEELIKTGISFYSEGKFSEAAHILELAGANPEALYWLSLSELSAGNFSASLGHLETLEKNLPPSTWNEEVPYHKGRCLYYLGRYEEALVSLKNYESQLSDSDPRKASALYWQGESHLALGRLDAAENVFAEIVEKYPNSTKYESSYYRLTIINQKKREVELLALLKWTHEESLRTMENYQEREKNYELSIAAYQKRISELLAAEGEGAAYPESTSEYYNDRLSAANRRIAELEASLAQVNADLISLRGGDTEIMSLSEAEREIAIRDLIKSAEELSDILMKMLNEAER